VCRGHEGRQGHAGCDKASRGPPALAHRHRLDLRGKRARSLRAAGFPGGRHGPRLDRASPGSPHHGRKPPARHPQFSRPYRPLPRGCQCPRSVSRACSRMPAARPVPWALNVPGKLPIMPGPATKDALIQVRGRDADDASPPAHAHAKRRGTRTVPPGCALVLRARMGVNATHQPGSVRDGDTVRGPRFRWP